MGGLFSGDIPRPSMPTYQTPTFQSILERFSGLRQALIGGGRAPHKPLLILLMLGRHQRGERGAVSFQSVRKPLADLLQDFGPPTFGVPDVVNPFWRLQNDEGAIWVVLDSAVATLSGRVAEIPEARLQASRVEVAIEKLPDCICMKIEDEGKSFQVQRAMRSRRRRHLGLLGMRERLEMVGGKFAFESAPCKGTTIFAQIPHDNARAKGRKTR